MDTSTIDCLRLVTKNIKTSLQKNLRYNLLFVDFIAINTTKELSLHKWDAEDLLEIACLETVLVIKNRYQHNLSTCLRFVFENMGNNTIETVQLTFIPDNNPRIECYFSKEVGEYEFNSMQDRMLTDLLGLIPSYERYPFLNIGGFIVGVN